MGTLTGTALIAQLRVTLLDPSPGTTWTDAMLLGYINSAQRAIGLLRPELFTLRGSVPLVAGTEQQLPAGSTGVFRFERNTASGRAVRLVDASLVDSLAPYWNAATAEVDVQDYMIDPRDRTRFRVLPPNNGNGALTGLRGVVPTALAAVGSTIDLEDTYEDPIKQFVLGECYAANTKRQDMAKATAARGTFANMLGINAQALAGVLQRTGANQPGMS